MNLSKLGGWGDWTGQLLVSEGVGALLAGDVLQPRHDVVQIFVVDALGHRRRPMVLRLHVEVLDEGPDRHSLKNYGRTLINKEQNK